MKPTSDYFKEKLQFKYGNHPNVDRNEIKRIAAIICELDTKEPGLTFSYNQNYVLVEKLNKRYRGDDIKICTFDFTNQEPRLFFNLYPEDFEAIDTSSRAEEFNYANFGGRAASKPFYGFNNHLISRQIDRRDEYFIEKILEVYKFKSSPNEEWE